MAPYTMTIDIHNDTDVAMEWIGYSNYSGLDGHTEVQFDQKIEAGKTGRVKISKSGGTDGLFTMASYYFPYRTGTVSIYAMMPASAGSDATAKLVDHSFYRKYSFVDSSKKGAATEWWDKRNYEEVTDGPFSENTIETEQAGEYKLPPGYGFQDVWRLTRTLKRDRMAYPDSSCTVRVTSKNIGSMNFNFDQFDKSYKS